MIVHIDPLLVNCIVVISWTVYLDPSADGNLATTTTTYKDTAASSSVPPAEFSNPVVVTVAGVKSPKEPGLIGVGGFIGVGHPANVSQTVCIIPLHLSAVFL